MRSYNLQTHVLRSNFESECRSVCVCVCALFALKNQPKDKHVTPFASVCHMICIPRRIPSEPRGLSKGQKWANLSGKHGVAWPTKAGLPHITQYDWWVKSCTSRDGGHPELCYCFQMFWGFHTFSVVQDLFHQHNATILQFLQSQTLIFWHWPVLPKDRVAINTRN